jgi:putative transposase
VRTTDSNHSMPVFSNLLNRDFTATAPNQRWVGDITPNDFISLAVVMGLFSREILGWSVSAVIDRHLAVAALEMAVKRRCPSPLPHQTDQGSQYASDDSQKKLDASAITCSMSRRGNCYDNAAMESLVWHTKDRTEVKISTARSTRSASCSTPSRSSPTESSMHLSLGYESPAEFERNASAVRLAA